MLREDQIDLRRLRARTTKLVIENLTPKKKVFSTFRVTNPDSGRTETKSAFSIATGIVMGSSKNDAFQAGFLVGRDFLGRTDAALDPGSKKVWLSFYVGYTLSQN